jgi:hypothetical protein
MLWPFEVIVAVPAKKLAKPVVFGARDFPYLVELKIDSLARSAEALRSRRSDR